VGTTNPKAGPPACPHSQSVPANIGGIWRILGHESDNVGGRKTPVIRLTPRCPKCDAPLKPTQIVAAGSFPCPNCGTKLQAPNNYGQWIAVGSLALSVGASLVLGFRGLHLLYAVLVLMVVIDYLAIHLLKYAVPPQVAIAVPPTPLRQLVREIMGPTGLNLKDKKRP
jgi:hypothetical protein